MKLRILYLFFLITLLISCKEVYHPNLDNNDKILVVNGLITNENKTHSISLSWARRFNGNDAFEAVNDAQVYITDRCSLNYYFSEGENGNYYSDSSLFIPQIGDSYKLNILLDNGEQYESDFQELIPVDSLGELSGEVVQKEFVVNDGNSNIVKAYDGIEACILIPPSNGLISKYRFDIKVFVQYSWGIDLGATQHTYYCWIALKNPNQSINITNSQFEVDAENFVKHSLCFLPKDLDFWSLERNYKCFVVNINAFRLNDACYKFYKKAYDQLEASDLLFDPIAVQLPSNIRCISNSNIKALGFFEVSSLYNTTYYIIEGYSSEIRCYENKDYNRNIRNSMCILDSVPIFWYSNYCK